VAVAVNAGAAFDGDYSRFRLLSACFTADEETGMSGAFSVSTARR
jgi:hypothetical protein